MAPNQPQPKPFRIDPPLVIALVFFIVTAFVSVIIVINPSAPNPQGTGTPIAADSYRAEVDALLAIAQPENADVAISKYVCIACHQAGSNQLAPSWVGLAARAASERPPLTAAAYIYESIVDPAAFIVEGYNDVMPHDYRTRMSQQELADILAYLLSPDAQ